MMWVETDGRPGRVPRGGKGMLPGGEGAVPRGEKARRGAAVPAMDRLDYETYHVGPKAPKHTKVRNPFFVAP